MKNKTGMCVPQSCPEAIASLNARCSGCLTLVQEECHMFSPVLCICFNLESGYIVSKFFILLLIHYGKVDVVK